MIFNIRQMMWNHIPQSSWLPLHTVSIHLKNFILLFTLSIAALSIFINLLNLLNGSCWFDLFEVRACVAPIYPLSANHSSLYRQSRLSMCSEDVYISNTPNNRPHHRNYIISFSFCIAQTNGYLKLKGMKLVLRRIVVRLVTC